MYWRRLIPVRRHPPVLVYQPLLEGRYDPCSRLPASPGRELLLPALVYQPILEGSYYPPALIYQLPLEGSYNPLTEGFNPQHYYGPHFINFHTGSISFHTTYLAGH